MSDPTFATWRPGARPWSRVLGRARRRLRSVAELLRARRARRRALRELMAELMALDERVLRDIGISRSAIAPLLRGTWFDAPQGRAAAGATEGGIPVQGRGPVRRGPRRAGTRRAAEKVPALSVRRHWGHNAVSGGPVGYRRISGTRPE